MKCIGEEKYSGITVTHSANEIYASPSFSKHWLVNTPELGTPRAPPEPRAIHEKNMSSKKKNLVVPLAIRNVGYQDGDAKVKDIHGLRGMPHPVDYIISPIEREEERYVSPLEALSVWMHGKQSQGIDRFSLRGQEAKGMAGGRLE